MRKKICTALAVGSFVIGMGTVVFAEEVGRGAEAPAPKKATVTVHFTEKKAASNMGGFKMGGLCLDEFPGSSMCRASSGMDAIQIENDGGVTKAWVKPVTQNTNGYFTSCYSWEVGGFDPEKDSMSLATLKQVDCKVSLPVACCTPIK